MQRVEAIVRELLCSRPPTDPGKLLDFETQLHQRIARELDRVTAQAIQLACEDPEVVEQAERLARGAGFRPQRSSVKVNITMLGGTTVSIETSYFLRRSRTKKSPGNSKKPARGKSGNGIYPVLAALGIHARTTPALMSEVGRLVAQGTLQEAQANLAVRGIHVGGKEIHTLARHLAKRALDFREWSMKMAGRDRTTAERVAILEAAAKGKRIAIAIDGGRIRTRIPKRGRRRNSGAHGYHADWREPKVFVVYEIDEQGRKKRLGLARYDGTMGDADRAFELLASLLLELGAQEAAEWVFLGDGGVWIWNRVAALVERVGFDIGKVTEILDFYHAVEHVNELLDYVPDWSRSRKGCWRKLVKDFLKRGDIQGLITWIERTMCNGPEAEAKKIRDHLGYLRDNEPRMQYQTFKRRGLPRGSGAIESGVRRVINLRLKGNGIFWNLANAEGVIHMRAQLLSNRWDTFMRAVLEPETQWAA
jgi:hypothetical protein